MTNPDPVDAVLQTALRAGKTPEQSVATARQAQDTVRLERTLENDLARRMLAEIMHSAGLVTPGTAPELHAWVASLYQRIEDVRAGAAAELLAEHAVTVAAEVAEDKARVAELSAAR